MNGDTAKNPPEGENSVQQKKKTGKKKGFLPEKKGGKKRSRTKNPLKQQQQKTTAVGEARTTDRCTKKKKSKERGHRETPPGLRDVGFVGGFAVLNETRSLARSRNLSSEHNKIRTAATAVVRS